MLVEHDEKCHPSGLAHAAGPFRGAAPGGVLWVGIVLGVVGAADGLRTSLKAMERMSRDKKKDGPSQAASFNDHD